VASPIAITSVGVGVKRMSITIFRGLPGSGKSKRLIEVVSEARSRGLQAATIVSADAPWIMGYDAYASGRKLASREPGGPSCPIDHFVSTLELERVLNHLEPDTLVAVEEAQMFGADAAQVWASASERGIDLILVSPSSDQVANLADAHYAEVNFSMSCELCQLREAVTVIVQPEDDRTISVCTECFDSESHTAKSQIIQLLTEELPHPGQPALYQPVELSECTDWRVSRPDSQKRLEVSAEILREFEIIDGDTSDHQTYLDIGCSTGFFCSGFQNLGMYAKGVDAVERNILIAKLLESFVRRARRPNKKFVTYATAEAYAYLRDSPDERFDVVSAFSVIQWVMTQRPVKDAYDCFDWMFAKARKACIVEMGYSSQDNYRELLPINVDREWVHSLMSERGRFSEIRVIDAAEAGIMRDLFIGVKPDVRHPQRRAA
jgi:SAM-dependent methyltransferase